MTYAIEYKQPSKLGAEARAAVTGAYSTVEDAKAAAERTVAREGATEVLVRTNGDETTSGGGDVVSELIEGVWHDRGSF